MSDRMVRKQIYIEPVQQARLKELSARLGVPESSLIRRGIDMTLRATPTGRWQPEIWEKELEFMRSLTPVGGPRTWSREDLYER